MSVYRINHKADLTLYKNQTFTITLQDLWGFGEKVINIAKNKNYSNENIDKDIRWLLTPNPEKEFLKNQSVREVKFLRSLNAKGSLIVAKLYSNQYLECFHTPYHVSDVTGVGGYNSLLYLCLLFKTLKKSSLFSIL